MARNYSNIQYETFEKANEAARRRAILEGVADQTYAVYPHWNKGGIKSWRISTHAIFIYRWTKNRCNRPTNPKQVGRTETRCPNARAGFD